MTINYSHINIHFHFDLYESKGWAAFESNVIWAYPQIVTKGINSFRYDLRLLMSIVKAYPHEIEFL